MGIDWIIIMICSEEKKESQKIPTWKVRTHVIHITELCELEFAYVQYSCPLRFISLLLSCSKETPLRLVGTYVYGNLIFAWSIDFKWISFFVSVQDNYFSFASDDSPLLEQEPARGLQLHICK